MWGEDWHRNELQKRHEAVVMVVACSWSDEIEQVNSILIRLQTASQIDKDLQLYLFSISIFGNVGNLYQEEHLVHYPVLFTTD